MKSPPFDGRLNILRNQLPVTREAGAPITVCAQHWLIQITIMVELQTETDHVNNSQNQAPNHSKWPS